MQDQILLIFIGGLLGGGVITSGIFLAFTEKLRNKFASISDLNGLGERVDEVEDEHAVFTTRLESINDRTIRLEEADKHNWQPVIQLIEKMQQRLEQYGNELSRISTILDDVTRRLNSRSAK